MPLRGPVKIGVDWVRAWNVERGPVLRLGGGGLLSVLSVLLVLLVLLCMAVAVTNVKRARKRPLVGRVVGIGHLFFILHLLHHTPKDTCTSTRFASSSDSDRDL